MVLNLLSVLCNCVNLLIIKLLTGKYIVEGESTVYVQLKLNPYFL